MFLNGIMCSRTPESFQVSNQLSSLYFFSFSNGFKKHTILEGFSYEFFKYEFRNCTFNLEKKE